MNVRSLADMPQLNVVLNDGVTMPKLVNDISGRDDRDSPSLNFFEWMFVRRCGIAWGIANSRQITINKVETLDAALIIMLPYVYLSSVI